MPGMGIVGNADLVIAVTRAGGLAFLGSAYMTEEEVDNIVEVLDADEVKAKMADSDVVFSF